MKHSFLLLVLLGSIASLGLTPLPDEQASESNVQVEFLQIAETPTETKLKEMASSFDKGLLIRQTAITAVDIIDFHPNGGSFTFGGD